jgi:hypothetical protein
LGKSALVPIKFSSGRADSANSGFIRLVPTSNTAFSGIRIILDHGITLEVDRGFDSLTLRETIDALRTLGG